MNPYASRNPKPAFGVVLHAHLPYLLGHGRWPHGTDWLCEATVETYLPLWRALARLVRRKRGPQVTVGLTPVLCEQLASPVFHDELSRYLDLKRHAAERDEQEFHAAGHGRRRELALRWRALFEETQRALEGLRFDLVAAFRDLQDRGAIEIITSAATHGYLPLLGRQSAIRAQLRTGVESYRRHFGRDPKGLWLPECGYRPGGPWYPPLAGMAPSYRPGLEDFLAPLGLEYFVVDAHLVTGESREFDASTSTLFRRAVSAATDDSLLTAPPRPPALQPTPMGLAPYQGYRVGSLVALARDPATSKLVWSAREGYPGDGRYLEFHKRHHPGGLRYWRVTRPGADLGAKEEYDETEARAAASGHAAHFAAAVEELLAHAAGHIEAPALVAPFDAELFGHWWFEGPVFLEEVLERLAANGRVSLMTLGDCARHPAKPIRLAEGSWGRGGGHDVWLDPAARFVWRFVYEAEERLESMVRSRAGRAGRLEARVLRQMARSLLLLEASDWPFLLSTGTAHDYADRRVNGHHEDFRKLYAVAHHLARGGAPTSRDLDLLESLERRDAVFPDLDPEWWR
jgi:1,4-alpha-glucan branching enzyme